MNDWATKAAQHANEEEHARNLETEKYVRNLNIKGQAGPQIFAQLQEWIIKQVAQYNKNRGKQELAVDVSQGHDLSSPCPTQEITVRRLDNSKGPLTITYSPSAHTISYHCGATGTVIFNLVVGDDGAAYFQTPYHVRKTVEQMGQEMLENFEQSVL
jgi:hypothetical protein